VRSKNRSDFAESLFENETGGDKGDRNAIDGKWFRGAGPRFWPDGDAQRRFETLWWECGRFLEITIETAAQPLVLHALTLRETRYPLENEGAFSASDERLARLEPALVRSLQMNAHGNLYGLPVLRAVNVCPATSHCKPWLLIPVARDARLATSAIRLINASRTPAGFTQSRYPSRDPQFHSDVFTGLG
jgi:hypothetical protein